MNKLIVLFTLISTCLFMVGCSDDDKDNELEVKQKSVQISVGAIFQLQVTGGSGKYTSSISDTTIAKVETESNTVLIFARKEGKAVITVVMIKAKGTLALYP